MRNPKRYFPDYDCRGNGGMEEVEGGDYVLWDDYAALLEKADRLDLEVQRLTTALRTADRVIKPLREKAQRENERR